MGLLRRFRGVDSVQFRELEGDFREFPATFLRFSAFPGASSSLYGRIRQVTAS